MNRNNEYSVGPLWSQNKIKTMFARSTKTSFDGHRQSKKAKAIIIKYIHASTGRFRDSRHTDCLFFFDMLPNIIQKPQADDP